MKKLKYVLFRLIAIGAGCFVALIISEILIRIISPQMTGPRQTVYDSQLGAIPVPNQKGRTIRPGIYDYTHTNNSLGFRGEKEYSFNKQTTFRLLFLGDSFTYGVGVDDKMTFVALIEEQLAKNYSIEAINAGNPNKGTDYEVKFFETVGYKFHPDITCLSFFPNDFTDNERGVYYTIVKDQIIPLKLSDTFHSKKQILSKIPLYDWLISWSHVANLLKSAATNYFMQSTHFDYNVNLKYSNERNQDLTKLYIDLLADRMQKAHSDFLIFYIPTLEEVEHYRQTKSFLTDELVFRKIILSNTEKFLSLTPILANSPYDITALYYSEGHWTPLAHKLSANAMGAFIENRINFYMENGVREHY